MTPGVYEWMPRCRECRQLLLPVSISLLIVQHATLRESARQPAGQDSKVAKADRGEEKTSRTGPGGTAVSIRRYSIRMWMHEDDDTKAEEENSVGSSSSGSAGSSDGFGSDGDDDDESSSIDENEEDSLESSSSFSREDEYPINGDVAFVSSSSLLKKFAVLGDSPKSLVASFLLLLLAVGYSRYVEFSSASATANSHHHQQQQNILNSSTSTTDAGRRGDLDRHSGKKDYAEILQSSKDKMRRDRELYEALGPVPQIDAPRVFEIGRDDGRLGHGGGGGDGPLLTDEMRSAYAVDGVIAVRGLLDHDGLLQRLDLASRELLPTKEYKKRRKGTQFHYENHSPMFLQNLTTVTKEDEATTTTTNNVTPNAFLEVAVLSKIPLVVAELMQIEARQQQQQSSNADSKRYNDGTIRVMRDIFLAKDSDPYICGWHVDDLGFWPATPESVGVNAWIALDDMTDLDVGGGFAVAVGSHLAPWRDEAHHVTGASTHFPPEGYKNASDMIRRRTGSGTCNLKKAAPHLNRRMEETKRVYAVQKGDVIFHTRWLFHRTVPFNQDELKKRTDSPEMREPIYRRYSVRYSPGTAVVPPGYGTELSVLSNEQNGGRTADDVTQVIDNGRYPWYPQVWPHPSQDELNRIPTLVQERFPGAIEKRRLRRSEMKPLLRAQAKEQMRPAL